MRSGIYPEMALVLWAAKRLGTAGQMDVRPPRGLRHRRARPRQRRRPPSSRSTPTGRSSACAWPSRSTSARISPRAARGRAPTMSAVSPACTRRRPSTWRRPASSRTRRRRVRIAVRGGPEATYAIERVIDLAARELRGRSGRAPPAEPHPAVGDAVQDRARLHVRLRRVRPRHGHGARRSPIGPGSRSGARRRASAARCWGSAIANPIEVAGGPYTAMNPDTAELRVNPDGSVALFAGSTSMGQGNETAFTQIVSDGLGVSPDAHPGVRRRHGQPRHRPGQRRLGRAERGRLGGDARGGQGDRARAPHRRASARGRAGGRRVSRRAVRRGGHRPRRHVLERRARRVPAAPASPGHGAGLQRASRVHAARRHVPQRLPGVRGRDRPRDRARCAWSATPWSTTSAAW